MSQPPGTQQPTPQLDLSVHPARHAAICSTVQLTGSLAARVGLVAALTASLVLAWPCTGSVEGSGSGRSGVGGGSPLAAAGLAAQVGPPVGRRPRVRVRLLADVRLPAPRGGLVVPVGARLSARVRLPSAAPGRLVWLQVRRRGWRPVATARTGSRGVATVRVPTGSAGRLRYRVSTAAGGRGTRSAAFLVEVRADPPPGVPSVPSAATVEGGPGGPDGPADAWSLLETGRPGIAFRWNPCAPVRYRAHLDGAPASMTGDLTEAVHRLAAATGLRFLDMGATDYSGTFADPDPHGWPNDADLLVTVADEAADPALAGSTVGYAHITHGSWTSTDARIDRAEVVLERQFVATAPTGFATTEAGSAELLLHELGHAVGLGHTSVAGQVMFPTLGSGQPPHYQNGDLNGLARVGATRGCLPGAIG